MSSMPTDEMENEEFVEVDDPNQLAADKEWLDTCI